MFVPTHRRAVSYIDKSREYYGAHGYDKAYQWATNDNTPFTSWLAKNKHAFLG